MCIKHARQKTPLENFLTMDEILDINKTLVLNTANGLPPEFWLQYCHTDDQKKHWHNTKENFQAIHCGLRQYFQGQEVQINVSRDKRVKRFYEAGVWYYIALYKLISSVFKEIQDLTPSPAIKKLSTPGLYFSKILESDSASVFDQCLTYTDVSSRPIYEFLRDYKKVEKLRQKPEKDRLKSEKLQIDNYEIKEKKIKGNSLEFNQLQEWTLKIAAKSKNKRVKSSLNIFQEEKDNLRKAIIGIYYPGKDQESYVWNKGFCNKT